MPSDKRIRLGMVGGGAGAFIGAVHRIASRIDDRYELIAGAFSSTPEKSLRSGKELGLPDDRIYSTFSEMAEKEPQRDDGIEAVSIVTPNHIHYEASKAFLEKGIHVICDKPLTSNLEDALALRDAANRSNSLFILTHNYTGYPMIRQARTMVQQGLLGNIRVVQAEYPQDWLSSNVESEGHKQADWRTDPARSGVGGSVGDIGTHAYNLVSFVTGLQLDSLCADLEAFVPGRRVDDNAHILLRFKGGAKGMLWSSQVAPGNENALRIRVYGEKGGLEWAQEDPNYLWYTPLGEPKRLLTRGGAGADEIANRVTRIPGGHPEGYLEGFANIYTETADAILAHKNSVELPADFCLPTVEDGVKGVEFIIACVESSSNNGTWISL